jgi:DNA polymerase-3 subunit delta'
VRENIEETLSARSPLEKYEDAEENLRDKWEKELKAAIEAEYRGQRADFLLALQWWLRDVWLHTLGVDQSPESNALSPNSETLLVFPQMAGTKRVAQRISPKAAMENLRIIEQLQRWLHTNVQEALALEVGLLKLHL